MQIFPGRVVEILKKWEPPRQVTFKCLPRGDRSEVDDFDFSTFLPYGAI